MGGKSRDIRPLILLIFLNIMGIMALIIKDSVFANDLAMLSTVMCMVAIITYVIVTKFDWGDSYLFVIVSMIASIGIIILSRLANTKDVADDAGVVQIKMFLVGVAAYFITFAFYRMFNKYLKHWTMLYFCAAIGLLVLTLIFGETINGAKNWIDLKFAMIQPSEFVRIFYVLSIAGIVVKTADGTLANVGKRLRLFDWKKISDNKKKYIRLFAVAFVALTCSGCLIMQRELGTILVFGGAYIAFLCIYGESRSFLVMNLAVLLIFMVVVVPILMAKFPATGSHYGSVGTKIAQVTGRIEAWKDPIKHCTDYKPGSNGMGGQVTKALIAVGNGGLTGTGIGNGAPYYIPEADNDGIFAAVCEEYGLMGGIGLLMLYFLLVYRGFKIALSTTNPFNKAVSTGLSIMLGVQTFVIVGGLTALIPLTGITLPFVSAGGSSMISTFMIIGILQAISSMKGETTDELE